MIIGIVGLGLIGGSLARAYKKAGVTVYGQDKDTLTADFVKLSGAIDGTLTDDLLGQCDCIFIAVTPGEAVNWLKENGKKIKKDGLVIDCCGIKRAVCEEGFRIARENGFNFVGGHPMAGKQVGGFKNSSDDMFEGAVFAIIPENKNDLRLISKTVKILEAAGFDRFSYMTAEEHDSVIAFTSQLTHLVSNAFIKSETACLGGNAVVAGSFRDLTRVAYLDENMWTELFMENRDNLLKELKAFINELHDYEDALERGDSDKLTRLLAEGKMRKEEVESNEAVGDRNQC